MCFNVRTATQKDIPDMRRIWTGEFGDSPEYVDEFYKTNFDRITVCVQTENDSVIGMLHMIPCEVSANSTLQKCYYVYAVAILPEYRGRGLMKDVFAAAFDKADRENASVILKPANRKLLEYYRDYGMILNGCWKKTEIPFSAPTGSALFSGISDSEYLSMRNAYYADIPHIKWDIAHIAWSAAENRLCGGESIKIEYKGNMYFAMTNNKNGILNITESSLSEKTLREISGDLLQRYQCHDILALFPESICDTGDYFTVSRNCTTENVFPNLLMI